LTRARGGAARVVAAALVAAACSGDADLTRALEGGAGRALVPAHALARAEWADLRGAFPGNDSLLLKPHTLCWTGARLAVQDQARQRVSVFDGRGRPVLTVPAVSERPLVEAAGVACAGHGREAALLLADQGAAQVWMVDSAGAVLRRVPAPMSPQGLPLMGETALADDGTWFVSWLGTRSLLGPYLSDSAWKGMPLVERRTGEGALSGRLGTPVEYRHTVARRVLNRVFMSAWRDTLWVLTQGDAAVQGFDRRGAPLGRRILLPVHFRGREPSITVREPLGGVGDFRYNTYDYHPNVGPFAVLGDSLFAVVRYRDWGWKRVGSGLGTFLPWASSAVEVYDRRGNLRGAFDAPGMVTALAGGPGTRVAVVSRLREDGSYHVYVAELPGAMLAGGPAEGACSLAAPGATAVCTVAGTGTRL
jgi:hypothetical protein